MIIGLSSVGAADIDDHPAVHESRRSTARPSITTTAEHVGVEPPRPLGFLGDEVGNNGRHMATTRATKARRRRQPRLQRMEPLRTHAASADPQTSPARWTASPGRSSAATVPVVVRTRADCSLSCSCHAALAWRVCSCKCGHGASKRLSLGATLAQDRAEFLSFDSALTSSSSRSSSRSYSTSGFSASPSFIRERRTGDKGPWRSAHQAPHFHRGELAVKRACWCGPGRDGCGLNHLRNPTLLRALPLYLDSIQGVWV